MNSVPSLRRRRRGLVAALAVAALALTGCGSEQSDSADAPGSTPASTPTGSPDPSASEDSTPITVAVPIYYAGDAGGQVRLFREFQQVEGVALTEAAKLVDGGAPLDPDYRTLWPGETVTSAEATGKVITVTLNADAFTERPDGMGERDAELAIQQMVHTLQGVEQSNAAVQFVRSGAEGDGSEAEQSEDPSTESEPTTLFGIDVSEPVKRAGWMRTLAMVNVTVPAQGGQVDGDTLDAEGLASSPEANVPWQILQGDDVVLEGFATAEGWMDKLHPWHVSIDVSDLAPGDYTFVAMTDDPSGGTEGNGPTQDSKEFTLG